MPRFASQQDAKEFLVVQIVLQAQRDKTPLADVERKMLYFSETDWTLPDIGEVNDAFDRDYDQDQYEKKITGIIRHALRHAAQQGREVLEAWADASTILREGDHYLLVMVDAAGA